MTNGKLMDHEVFAQHERHLIFPQFLNAGSHEESKPAVLFAQAKNARFYGLVLVVLLL